MEPTLPSTEFLFDFLYSDTQRVATYLSQLDPNGVLTGIKSTHSSSETVSATGRFNLGVASHNMTTGDAETGGGERTFDPAWVLPITMLNRLDELGFVGRNLSTAPIGSLVLIKGYAKIVDIAAVRAIWPVIGKAVARKSNTEAGKHNNRQQRRAAGRDGESQSPLSPSDMIDAVTKLPHALELHFASDGGVSWSSLKPSFLLSSSDDVALKHGDAIPGVWNLLGIVDARPYEDITQAWENSPQNSLSTLVGDLIRSIREIMGRPHEAYGITPVMLFRAISRVSTAPPLPPLRP